MLSMLEISLESSTRRSSTLKRRRIRLVDHLQTLGINVSETEARDLPSSLDEYQAYYGYSPRIIGAEEYCQGQLGGAKMRLAPAGLFNTGTNLLAQLLEKNCKVSTYEEEPTYWMVPWGKHSFAYSWGKRTAKNYEEVYISEVLPVVAVRDPYEWMNAMCRNPYVVAWGDEEHEKSEPFHGDGAYTCPLLVDPDTNETVPVMVGKEEKVKLPSLAHYWNDWNRGYVEVTEGPRLMVRLEDLVMYPKEVVTTLCDCAGGDPIEDMQFLAQSAKEANSYGHGKELTGALKAWQRLASRMKDPTAFLPQDATFARSSLSQDLMQLFGYQHPLLEGEELS